MPPLHLQRATMKKQINRRDRFGILPSVCRGLVKILIYAGKKTIFLFFSFDCPKLGQYNDIIDSSDWSVLALGKNGLQDMVWESVIEFNMHFVYLLNLITGTFLEQK